MPRIAIARRLVMAKVTVHPGAQPRTRCTHTRNLLRVMYHVNQSCPNDIFVLYITRSIPKLLKLIKQCFILYIHIHTYTHTPQSNNRFDSLLLSLCLCRNCIKKNSKNNNNMKKKTDKQNKTEKRISRNYILIDSYQFYTTVNVVLDISRI